MDKDYQARLRKYNSNIILSSGFIILYVFWQMIKFLMSMFWGAESVSDLLEISKEDYEAFKFFFIIAIVVIFFVFFSFHIYVGISAYRYGRGKKKKTGFLVVTTILFVFSIWQGLLNFSSGKMHDTVIASFILDATLCLILFDLIYSTVKVKKIRKITGEAG